MHNFYLHIQLMRKRQTKIKLRLSKHENECDIRNIKGDKKGFKTIMKTPPSEPIRLTGLYVRNFFANFAGSFIGSFGCEPVVDLKRCI